MHSHTKGTREGGREGGGRERGSEINSRLLSAPRSVRSARGPCPPRRAAILKVIPGSCRRRVCVCVCVCVLGGGGGGALISMMHQVLPEKEASKSGARKLRLPNLEKEPLPVSAGAGSCVAGILSLRPAGSCSLKAGGDAHA